jgi:hypothetical protein
MTTQHRHHARGEWVTKEGRVIPVAEMETSHLVNVAKLMTRQVARLCADEWHDIVISAESFLHGEGALNSIDGGGYEYTDVDDEEFTEYLAGEPFWPHLSVELDKRHIDVVKLVNDHLAENGYDFRLTKTTMPKRFTSEDDDNYGLTWPDNL